MHFQCHNKPEISLPHLHAHLRDRLTVVCPLSHLFCLSLKILFGSSSSGVSSMHAIHHVIICLFVKFKFIYFPFAFVTDLYCADQINRIIVRLLKMFNVSIQAVTRVHDSIIVIKTGDWAIVA